MEIQQLADLWLLQHSCYSHLFSFLGFASVGIYANGNGACALHTHLIALGFASCRSAQQR
jgi:hypothetical protein